MIRAVESDPSASPFTGDELYTMYTACFSLCTQPGPNDYAAELIARFRSVFERYLTDVVRACCLLRSHACAVLAASVCSLGFVDGVPARRTRTAKQSRSRCYRFVELLLCRVLAHVRYLWSC